MNQPHPDSTALRLSLEIQAEITALEAAKERGDWGEVVQSAHVIGQYAAILCTEQRSDEAGIVRKS